MTNLHPYLIELADTVHARSNHRVSIKLRTLLTKLGHSQRTEEIVVEIASQLKAVGLVCELSLDMPESIDDRITVALAADQSAQPGSNDKSPKTRGKSPGKSPKRQQRPRTHTAKRTPPNEAASVGSVRAACLEYGRTPTPELLHSVAEQYKEFTLRCSDHERQSLMEQLTELVERSEAAYLALLPIVLFEPSTQLASTASLNLAVLANLSNGPLAGAEFLMRLVKDNFADMTDKNKGAILTGLVLLGDRRVLSIVKNSWTLLGPDGREVLARATSGLVTTTLIEFFLTWLEKTSDKKDFGAVAGTLAKLPDGAMIKRVCEIERVLPAPSPDSGLEPIKILQTWTFKEYARQRKARFARLARKEHEPKVIPVVYRIWNGPATRPETARAANVKSEPIEEPADERALTNQQKRAPGKDTAQSIEELGSVAETMTAWHYHVGALCEDCYREMPNPDQMINYGMLRILAIALEGGGHKTEDAVSLLNLASEDVREKSDIAYMVVQKSKRTLDKAARGQDVPRIVLLVTALRTVSNKLIGTLKDAGLIRGYFCELAEIYLAAGLRIYVDDRGYAEDLLAEDF